MDEPSSLPPSDTFPTSPTPLDPPPIPTANPSRLPLILMTALFLLASAVAIFFYLQSRTPVPTAVTPSASPTPVASADPTAGWQTYTNPTYAYSFKYPAAWEIVDLTSGKDVEVYYQPDRTKPVGELLIEKLTLAPPNLAQYTDSRNIGGITAQCMSSPDMIKTWCFLEQQMLSILIIDDTDDAYNTTLDQILTTFRFSDPVPTQNPVTSSIKLTYHLPDSWATVQNTGKSFEIGYDPAAYIATSDNSFITLADRSHPGSFSFMLTNYDGGSRHSFIYQQMGYNTAPLSDRLADYHEEDYSISGWRCLVLYGLSYSAAGTTWGMCPISSSQAIFFGGPDDQGEMEKIISTLKFNN